MKAVILLGGAVFKRGEAVNRLRGACNSISTAFIEGHRLGVVAGGGELAREYIRLGRELGLDECTLDLIGIEATRMHALLVFYILRNVIPARYLGRIEDAYNLGEAVAVCGGISPGHSTDATAALLAEILGAQLVIKLTESGGVYRRGEVGRGSVLREVTTGEIRRILEDSGRRAGEYELLDHVAVEIIERAGQEWMIVPASNPRIILDILRGEKGVGTRVVVGGSLEKKK
ncbi:MAG: hypothetical protein DRN99_00895 [Thermoproteota archaeon]|nr:MAG: hypothetical protein DRN99_00895 [Candidatus Korarchaeota archaeon]